MKKKLAEAIIDMDNIAYHEGLSPVDNKDWDDLVAEANRLVCEKTCLTCLWYSGKNVCLCLDMYIEDNVLPGPDFGCIHHKER